MLRITEVRLPIDHPEGMLRDAILEKLSIPAHELSGYTVFRRGVDARKQNRITFIYTLDVETPKESEILARMAGDPRVRPAPDTRYRFVAHAPAALKDRPVVIGTGPCGLFAGLVLAQSGFRPILLERGRSVRERTADTFRFWRKRAFDPESNVQFGEGGAGTFSDGKLYTQIRDPRHLTRKVLTELVAAGAPPEILYVSKPHIGTFKLVKVVEAMRKTIVSLGGEVRFRTRVRDIEIRSGEVRGVVLDGGEKIPCTRLVSAIGHSARDTFEMLADRGIPMTAKPFSVGLRIEHPQAVIDRARFGKQAGHPLLGAADYRLVHHCQNGRSVYSFCMCPGGTVVAATSEVGCVVTNGMSQYARSARNANSAIVVGVTPEDYPGGPLSGIAFQRRWEQRAFLLGGENYDAPGQRVEDFLAGRPSTGLGTVRPSYRPGVDLTDLAACLPDYAVDALREAIPAFDRKLRGFAMDDAILTGVETRTSSPLRILRGGDGQSTGLRGLFPAGEGAGYAGGIVSSAVDGIEAAEAVALSILETEPATTDPG
ncbi:NAD(P)/FAD-dependent oxidoreductase [Desulfococcus sp.]|uniref:NAD(P)/FAD-dependent oxidoreductase n=1 Tax=Desulfococcus sp. TaxID=2025834 RepID=UPI0035931ADD